MIKKIFTIIIATIIHLEWHQDIRASLESTQKKTIILPAYHQQLSLADFTKEVLWFPLLVNIADEIIIVVPENLNGFTPLSLEAPLIERARVLITWASILQHSEMNNAHIKIITTKNSHIADDQLLDIIKRIDSRSEQSDRLQFFSFEDLLAEKDKNALSKNSVYFFSDNIINNLADDHPKNFTTSFSSPTIARILITGGAGFIGSHLAKKFLEKGYQVIAMDNLSCCSMENIQDILTHPHFHFIEHDVAQPFTIDGELHGILHLASVPSPEMYYRMPLETMKAGLHGTKNCLEIARKKKARFLFTSTSEVYGNPEINPQTEDYPGNVNITGPRAQYDQSKRGGETFVKLYFDEFNLDARIARIFNTYGPHMQLGDGRVVTNFIRAVLKNESMVIYGNGKQTRSFAYVDDTVDGIIKLYETENITPKHTIEERVFNIGNPDEFTILELAEAISILTKEYLNKETSIELIEQIDVTDPKLRCPELSRSQQVFGFFPQICLREGLKKTFQYFLAQEQKNR